MKKIKFSFLPIFLMLMININAQTLTEKLGNKATDRLLIVNCDDVGVCHSSNLAVIEGMENGAITSGTIMTPCPWYNETVTDR